MYFDEDRIATPELNRRSPFEKTGTPEEGDGPAPMTEVGGAFVGLFVRVFLWNIFPGLLNLLVWSYAVTCKAQLGLWSLVLPALASLMLFPLLYMIFSVILGIGIVMIWGDAHLPQETVHVDRSYRWCVAANIFSIAILVVFALFMVLAIGLGL